MNLIAGYPYDLIRNGVPFDYPRLSRNCKTDVVVMGGGISGALVAHYLLKAGIACIVVDGRTIGLGSTCASTSLLQYEIDEPLWRLSAKIGVDNAARAYHLCGAAITELEDLAESLGYTEFERCNSVYFSASPRDTNALKKEFSARKDAGFAVEWQEGGDLKKRYGLNAAAAIVSSLAAKTNAYTLTHALHQYSIQKGIQVFDRTRVTNAIHNRSGVKLETADGYTIRCKKLVYATGYESVKYIDKKIVQLSSTYATASEQLTPETAEGIGKDIFWNTATPYLYMRGTRDNRILVGGRDTKYRSLRSMQELIPRKTSFLKRDLGRYLPAIPFKNEFSWAGVFGSTKDGLPFIGNYPRLPNSLFALGFGGNGITFSVIAAKLIAKSIEGAVNTDISLFSFNRV